MALTNEIVVIFLAYILNYVLVMNMGRNIGSMRRFAGASLTVLIGYVGAYVLRDTLLFDETGWILIMISVIYFVIQIGVILNNFISKDFNQGQLNQFDMNRPRITQKSYFTYKYK